MKKILVFATFCLMLASANASYLMWQVDQGSLDSWSASSAYLYATTSGIGTGSTMIDGLESAGSAQWLDVSAYAGNNYSFYIEYVNSQDASVAVSDLVSYENLSGYLTTSSLSIPTLGPWHGGTMHVPEPTSGLLMLIGMAGLALKRRKA